MGSRTATLFTSLALGIGAVASLPAIAATASSPRSATPSTISHPTWPQGLPAAYAVPSEGYFQTNFHSAPVAIASLTKMMTAVVVEQHLPLGTSGTGPSWTVTAADVKLTKAIAKVGGVTITVRVGEQLSEHLLLEGLLIRSANNFAVMLSELTGMRLSSFVWDMNQEARVLGMNHTHYVDPHGLNDGDTSTPADQLIVAQKLETYPLLAKIAAMTSVAVPIDGSVATWTPMLGHYGIIGVKTGTTDTAGGCDVMLVLPHVGKIATPVYVAVFGAHGNDVLASAGNIALTIEREVASYIKAHPPTTTTTQPPTSSTSSTTSSTTTSGPTTTLP